MNSGAAMKLKPGAARLLLWSGAGLLLALVFFAYLRPDMALAVATRVWNCF